MSGRSAHRASNICPGGGRMFFQYGNGGSPAFPPIFGAPARAKKRTDATTTSKISRTIAANAFRKPARIIGSAHLKPDVFAATPSFFAQRWCPFFGVSPLFLLGRGGSAAALFVRIPAGLGGS